MTTERSSIGLLYTGGTIGMEAGVHGLAITADAEAFEARLRTHLPADCPDFERLDVALPLMDSSNAQPDDWRLLGRRIYQHRSRYAGFVILTGTDTMAYTASALSFLLDGLDLPVVLTGAMRPLGAARTPTSTESAGDAVGNVSAALHFCQSLGDPARTQPLLNCVFLAFDGCLLRGNCARKIDSRQLHAFQSPNLPPVGRFDDGRAALQHDLLYRPRQVDASPGTRLDERFEALDACTDWNEATVAHCVLMPGAAAKALASAVWPGCRALLMFSYGYGNIPSNDTALLKQLERLRLEGLLLLNTTQCLAGGVGRDYEAAHALGALGVRSAGLMTPEAAYTKLHLLSRLPALYAEALLDTDICGEQSQPF